MIMKKALIFDFGGVLVDLDVERCKAAFKSDLGYYNIDNILDACHQKGFFADMEEGKLSADGFRSIVLSESRPGALPEDVDTSLLQILSGMAEYKARLLTHLSKSYDLYLLTNNNPIVYRHMTGFFAGYGISFSGLFRKCFVSYEMGLLKPSAEFYRRVIEEIGCPAEEMLFIDDSPKNVEGAIAAGLPAVCYEQGSDMAAMLADVLGDPSLTAFGGPHSEEGMR